MREARVILLSRWALLQPGPWPPQLCPVENRAHQSWVDQGVALQREPSSLPLSYISSSEAF